VLRERDMVVTRQNLSEKLRKAEDREKRIVSKGREMSEPENGSGRSFFRRCGLPLRR
jgi:hypothetical protein